ncbi:bifunctional aldolase/short-chain dehydrogenase [Rhizosphaericola mali]|uniref:Bifunctional aldolase/short-chain dehydrogenase n=1 Tax=Rhizosphaericola mali TaxID=2545455 RepID=A0A5P2GAP3_9BACT|nr:bifunctional aldolase/short-chain dehydrogenase [Rhizosphaericola mali]QES88621.1 bifunctional aldolase/short-chain dehydrogenase [Rhizosphaericola mali]
MKTYKYVNYLWDDQKAAELEGDEVALLIYRSNILGADLRITNYGGGNTSCKTVEKDPLTGNPVDVMWIKGSGGDIGTLTKKGLAALYVDKLRSLTNVYRGIEYEDEMVQLFNHCIFDLGSKAPSIDTPLHGFLPFKHIDHLHPDAAIAIAAAKDGNKITQELFNGEIGWVEWQRPGFDLGLKLKQCLDESPNIKGIMLGSHGLFTWGNTAYESYVNTLDVIEKCSEFIEESVQKNGSVFGGAKIVAETAESRKKQAANVAPLLRGLCSEKTRMIGHFTDSDRVLEFINSNDLEKLAPLGTSCPDHFLRTKIQPLILDLAPNEDFSDYKNTLQKIEAQFVDYRNMYADYYNTCKHDNSPAMRDANPVVIIYPGIGMFTFAKDKQTARVASEFFVNAINVMRGSEAISDYTALPRQEAFNIEYWLLEEAKLQRMPQPKALSGKIALVTGSGGGIGAAIAKKLLLEGACIVLNDINQQRLDETQVELVKISSKDQVDQVLMDVTDANSIAKAFEYAALKYGGMDIIVNNAGLSISKPIAEHTIEDWDILYNIMPKGQFIVSKCAVAILRKQNIGGDIINIVSKNSIVAGPNNVGYGSAKAAQAHLSRLLAAELGSDKIRVNSVNPDAVIVNSNIWAGGWAEGRAKAYGITVEELPQYYANRTLLKEMILPEDIANACFSFLNGLLEKSTGNILNVDGGVAMGFVR